MLHQVWSRLSLFIKSFFRFKRGIWQGFRIIDRHLFLYLVIGSFCATLDYFSFFFLKNICYYHYQKANLMSVGLGVLVSFLLNYYINFQAKTFFLRRMFIFFSVAFLGYGLSAGILWFLVSHNSYSYMLAKLISIPLVVGFQFLANRFITFRFS